MRIYTEGGILAFWTGNGLSIAKIFPESAIRFFAYESSVCTVSCRTLAQCRLSLSYRNGPLPGTGTKWTTLAKSAESVGLSQVGWVASAVNLVSPAHRVLYYLHALTFSIKQVSIRLKRLKFSRLIIASFPSLTTLPV